MLRGRETLLWAFVMPVLFFYFIGAVTGGNRQQRGTPSEPIAVYAPPEAGFLAERLIERLEQLEFRVIRVDSEKALGEHGRRLLVPADYTARVQAGEPVKLRLELRGGGPSARFDEFRAARAVYGQLADVVIVGRGGGELSAEALAELDQAPRAIQIQVEPAGARRRIPTGFEQSVPGTIVMFTLLVVLTTGGVTLFLERRDGLLRRLASAPMSRAAVVAGKWGARLLLALVQVAFAMIVGAALFDIDWSPLPGTLALLAAWAALIASIGVLYGAWAKSDGQAIGIGVISTNVLAALGGCWWPIEITPPWAQQLALLLPTGWAMDGLHKLLSFGMGPAAVTPHVAAMLATAAAALAVAARRFRFI